MVVPLMQDGQPDSLAIDAVNFAAQDFPTSVFAHESSAVSSASFPLARLAWHFRMHAISLSAAFPAPDSHFAVGLLAGGRKPVSSPPNGVCARADTTHRPTTSAATTDPVRNMLPSFHERTFLPRVEMTPKSKWFRTARGPCQGIFRSSKDVCSPNSWDAISRHGATATVSDALARCAHVRATGAKSSG